MKKRNFFKAGIVLLSALLLAMPVFAQDGGNPAEAAVAEAPAAPKGKAKRNRILEIEAFNAKLDSVFSILNSSGIAAASPIYGQAKGRLREAASMISQKPKTKESTLIFSVCSVTASAALMQLEREVNLAKARQMGAQRDSLLFVLHKLHETINRIEGSKANRLSQDLEAAKVQASILQGDLEATKEDLDATKAQATILKEDLVAERERARKLMEDAQKKFSALHSEMINVSKDARGTIISMSDILFESGKANLTENLKTNLAKIAGILIVYKDPKVLIEGHTDNVGAKDFNQKLSENRASAVLGFLVEQGVPAERLSSMGCGFDKPIADNNTNEGRAKNRRVDLIVQDGEGTAAPAASPAPTATPAPAVAPAPAPAAAPAAKPATPPPAPAPAPKKAN